jgi:hypothetical protein
LVLSPSSRFQPWLHKTEKKSAIGNVSGVLEFQNLKSIPLVPSA